VILRFSNKYKDLPGDAILPLVSQQKYNIAIKKILKHAGIDRTVTWLNPTTGEPEPRPIYEVLSSHSARKAFARYREIDEQMKKDLVSMLE
jgi:hypothetical protein